MKTKALISFAVTTKLICVFVFSNAKSRFSHNEAQMYELLCDKRNNLEFLSSEDSDQPRHWYLHCPYEVSYYHTLPRLLCLCSVQSPKSLALSHKSPLATWCLYQYKQLFSLTFSFSGLALTLSGTFSTLF